MPEHEMLNPSLRSALEITDVSRKRLSRPQKNPPLAFETPRLTFPADLAFWYLSGPGGWATGFAGHT